MTTYRVLIRVFQDYEIDVESDSALTAETKATRDYDLHQPYNEDIEIIDVAEVEG